MRDCKTQQSTEGLQQVQQLSPSVLVEIVGHAVCNVKENAVCNVKENKVFAENLRIELSNYSYQEVQLHVFTLSNRNTLWKADNF